MVIFDIINPLYSASGFAVGVLVGLTGVGGGSLMTPLLVLVFGFHPATAVGTDLLYAAITKSAGTAVHGWRGTVDWRITGRLAVGSVPATAITLFALHHFGVKGEAATGLISTVLGVALILTAIAMVLRQRLLDFVQRHLPAPNPRRTTQLTVLTGVVLGVLVSLSSIGAGSLGVTVLFLLYPRLQTARIVGSDIAHAVPLCLVAGIGYWLLGTVDWSLLLSLLVGSLPGIALGSVLASRVPDLVLRPVLASALLLASSRLLI